MVVCLNFLTKNCKNRGNDNRGLTVVVVVVVVIVAVVVVVEIVEEVENFRNSSCSIAIVSNCWVEEVV